MLGLPGGRLLMELGWFTLQLEGLCPSRTAALRSLPTKGSLTLWTPFHDAAHRCRLTFLAFTVYSPAYMEKQMTNIDLSQLDTAAMRSRLSELGCYL